MNPLIPDPADWMPATPEDLIGQSGTVLRTLLAKARRPSTGGWRILLTGPPGCGKTTVNLLLAKAIEAHPVETEVISGKKVNAEAVESWLQAAPLRSLWPGVSVKVIEELDRSTPDGLILLLRYLDAIKTLPHRAVLTSSNHGIADLDARLQSRFQHFPVAAPSAGEIERFLRNRVAVGNAKAKELSLNCAGDVRAALLDAQSFLDMSRATSPCLAA